MGTLNPGAQSCTDCTTPPTNYLNGSQTNMQTTDIKTTRAGKGGVTLVICSYDFFIDYSHIFFLLQLVFENDDVEMLEISVYEHIVCVYIICGSFFSLGLGLGGLIGWDWVKENDC